VDRIVLPPQPVPGTGGALPQAKIARIGKQCRVNNFETEIVFDGPALHNLFDSL
jgi:hypothetical protein